MEEKIIELIGNDNYKKIKNKKILLVGVGGVGATALETLIRSGFENITIIDNDIIEESNMNRQIITNSKNIGKYKVDEAYKRCTEINPKANIIKYNIYLNKQNMNLLNTYDYIIDACDSIETKIDLIKYAIKDNIKIIISLGMANRLNPTDLKITTLDKTENDPLAKKLRSMLKKEGISLKLPVVCSCEKPIKNNTLPSMMMVPSVCGIYLVYYIINDIIKE